MLVVAVDEHSAFVIGRRIHRAAHGIETASMKPSFGRGEQHIGDVLIVSALEEPKEADAIAVKLVVGTILDCRDAANRPAVAERKEKLPVRLAVERVRFFVERVTHRDAQRRHPLWMIVAVIDLPREIDKAAQIARGFD